MGIFDDAIRQHLELKRRQGADDDVLARLEDEAFGPPTRPGEPDFPSAETPADIPGAVELQPAADAQQTEIAVEPDEDEEPPGASEEPAAAESVPPDLEVQEGSGEVGLDELDLDLDDEFAEPGELEADEPTASSFDAVEHPLPVESLDTVEHAVEGGPPAEDEDEDEDSGREDAPRSGEEGLEEEDVLEETPEFLRDQPEDDELWFEQGEPKDFDF